MPNTINDVTTPGVAVNANLLSWNRSLQVTDDQGHVLNDFTGDNALKWPTDVASLPLADQQDLAALALEKILQVKSQAIP